MKHHRLPIIIVILALTFSPWANGKKRDWREIDPKEFAVDAPPIPGSEEFSADFNEILYWQGRRTDEQCELGRAQEDHDFETLFESIGLLSPEEFKRAKATISQAMEVAKRASRHFKGIYRRPRPYDIDYRVEPCVHKSKSKAYPSTHATVAITAVCLLSEMFPERRERFLAYGKSLGEIRVIVGAHHPSDVRTGQTLGMEVCQRILRDPSFNLPILN